MHASLGRLNAAGARIILGCDTGLPDHFFGYAEQRELELMAAAGMSPAQVIVARRAVPPSISVSRTPARSRRAGERISWCSTRIRWTTYATRGGSLRIYIGGREVDRAALRASLVK
jgi:hypothetical protein